MVFSMLFPMGIFQAPDDGDGGGGDGGGAADGGENADPGAGAGGSNNNSGGGNNQNAGANAGAGDGPANKTFTQADVDRIVNDRLERERKKAAGDLKKAQMTEAERLKAEKEEADKRSTEATTAANQRVIRSEAKVIALAAGVKAERLDYALKLLDLSGIEISESGDPDAKAIKAAVDTLAKDFPELLGQAGSPKGGGDFSGGNSSDPPLTDDLIAKMDNETLKRRMPEITAYYAAKRK